MDDELGQPSFLPPRGAADEGDETSGEEDVGPDWTKLLPTTKLSLPKRGDKEFEPAADGPTQLQTHSLKRSRDAMFGALSTARGISNKSASYAVWYPELMRAHVTQARGVLFNGMGHSVARGGDAKGHKRTELLPEETLYLIERGSLFCWKHEPSLPPPVNLGENHLQGSPMSVQQAFAEMIGRDDLTLERYQAFAYLKRLGFNVIRAKPPTAAYPTAPLVKRRTSLLSFVSQLMSYSIFMRLWKILFGRIDWWKPLRIGGWLGYAHDYASVYRSLRVIPSGHNVPLHSSTPKVPSTEQPTPYEIFYNIYKPNTPFKKSAPPQPDHSLVVVNARTTPLPTIQELTHIWSFLPETGPPPPRQRNRAKLPQPPPTEPPPPPPSHSFWWPFSSKRDKPPPERKPHPFSILKSGKKTVVIGVVDSGTIGFFRFGMGAFEETPMI